MFEISEVVNNEKCRICFLQFIRCVKSFGMITCVLKVHNCFNLIEILVFVEKRGVCHSVEKSSKSFY